MLSISIRSGKLLGYLSYGGSRGLQSLNFDLSSTSRVELVDDNVSTLTNSTGTAGCNKLVDDSELKDGRIPEILGVSIGLWLVLLLAFIIIRYCATDYSRVGLVTTTRWAKAMYNRHSGAHLLNRSHSGPSPLENEDNHWYTWIPRFFKLRDSEIRLRCGPDASLYLGLQRYLIVLLCVFTFLSLVVILPVNYFSGDNEADGGFPRTTITNIGAKSDVLWVHTVFSLLYLCITLVFMIHYSIRLGKHQEILSTHTVMVQWIPKYVHREDIMQHFQEALPNSRVVDVQLAYDVSELMKLSKEICNVNHKLQSVESVRVELGEEERIFVGWRRICPFSDRHKVDASTYYQQRQHDLKEDINQEKLSVRDKRLRIGFVTFASKDHAKRFYCSHKLCRNRPHSSMHKTIGARWWQVLMAPHPQDILWENLAIPCALWWIRWIAINLALFLFLFFFTTPAIILAGIDNIRVHFVSDEKREETAKEFSVDPLITSYISSILLLVVASLLPYCVARICYIEGHWTKSVRQQAIMTKTYIFLVIMVILLPSIGLASLNAVGELALRGEESVRQRLQCVYLPNSGAFFIAYVITLTFIGTAVELLRVPELLGYVFRRLKATTIHQRQQALKKASRYDFMYGVQYAWNLVIFTMVVTFSLTTPVIVPFGVLYFMMKYYTDKYNIYYVYRPASFNGQQFLHQTAVTFVISGVVILQLSTLFFSLIRLGKPDPRTILMIVILILTFITFIGLKAIGFFSHLIPQLRIMMGKNHEVFGARRGYVQDEINEEEETLLKGAYIPPALKRETVELISDDSEEAYQSFGSADHMGRYSPRSLHSESSSPSSSGSKSPTEAPDGNCPT